MRRRIFSRGFILLVLVTGATGYIGGRLVPRLLERGERVRVLVRDRQRIAGRPWVDQVEIIQGDILDPHAAAHAAQHVDVAYYLVHAMAGSKDFARQDRLAANCFGQAAKTAGIRHVIYLGGLQPQAAAASEHLSSRAEVGQILAQYRPVTEFRAGPIIGSGSASFEMVRYLTERLPIMVAPKWILNQVQPIGVRDTLSYLLAALEKDAAGIVEIGADVLTFKAMMLRYAAARGLRRIIIPVPVLAPGLAARWIGAVTPIPNRLAVPLVHGVVQPLTVTSSRAKERFPHITPMPYHEAVSRALERIGEGRVETRWSGALGKRETVTVADEQGMIREIRTVASHASPDALYRSFSTIGGERGWLVWDWAWRLRGLLDKLVGGPGLRRGRRDALDLFPGEALDWWRVEAIEKGRLLRLRAEMKLPGRAWIEWQVRQEQDQQRLVQTAMFEPWGVGGFLYWYALYPLHRLIFTDLARAIVRDAENNHPPSNPRLAQPSASPPNPKSGSPGPPDCPGDK